MIRRSRRRRLNSRFRKVGTTGFRVTLHLTRSEKDKLRNKARELMPLAPNGNPRTGILVTEILRDWWERTANE